MINRLTILLIVIMGSANLAEAKHIKIYLLTGQSNSLGTTANKKDKDPAHPPASPLDKNIAFFWSNRSTAAADGPAAIIGDSGGKITTLKQQQGQGRNTTFWGPEISFGRALYEAGERDFLIVKASRGGGGNGFWRKGEQMYQHILQTMLAATKLIEKSDHTFEVVCMLYLQGESDSVNEAKVAGKNLGELIDHIKMDLPNAMKMMSVIGGIGAAGAKRDTVRLQQKKLAEGRADVRYFSNLDLKGQLYDRLHFDQSAKLEIGRRFARELRTLMKKGNQ